MWQKLSGSDEAGDGIKIVWLSKRVTTNSNTVLTEVNGEGAPLHGRRVKVPVVDVQVPRADCLRSQTVEQGNFGSAGNANCKRKRSEFFKIGDQKFFIWPCHRKLTSQL